MIQQINPLSIYVSNNINKSVPTLLDDSKVLNNYDVKIFGNDKIDSDKLFNDRIVAVIRPDAAQENKKRSSLSKEDVLGILQKARSLTLLSGSLLKEFYDKDNFYDFPLLFAAACYNSKDKFGQYIVEKMPKIFEGIDKEELFTVLDAYSETFRRDYIQKDNIFKSTIDGKDFYFKSLGSGAECCAFSVSDSMDDDSKSVIYKIYNDGATFAPCWFYGNIGMLREANMAGVIDVPELYFANTTLSYPDFSGVGSGCWAIIENAKHKTIKSGLKLTEWLEQMGLKHYDDRRGNRINGICVDLGFIKPIDNIHLYGNGWGDAVANSIFSGYLDGKTTEDLINDIKNSCTSCQKALQENRLRYQTRPLL